MFYINKNVLSQKIVSWEHRHFLEVEILVREIFRKPEKLEEKKIIETERDTLTCNWRKGGIEKLTTTTKWLEALICRKRKRFKYAFYVFLAAACNIVAYISRE